MYGPSGLCAGVARGFVHAVNGRSGKRANLVPADYCVNAMISAAWDVFRRLASESLQFVEKFILKKNI